MYRKQAPSTTQKLKYGTLSKAPPPQGHSAAKPLLPGPRRLDHRAPLVVTVQWLPGSEPWFEVRCGEYVCRRPADTTLLDLVLHLNGYERT